VRRSRRGERIVTKDVSCRVSSNASYLIVSHVYKKSRRVGKIRREVEWVEIQYSRGITVHKERNRQSDIYRSGQREDVGSVSTRGGTDGQARPEQGT